MESVLASISEPEVYPGVGNYLTLSWWYTSNYHYPTNL